MPSKAMASPSTAKCTGRILTALVKVQQSYRLAFCAIFTAIIVVRTPAEAQQTFDYVVCAHKAIAQSTVSVQLAPAVDAIKTTLVIIQNGVGNEEPFRNTFPDNTIITCVVRHANSLSCLPFLYLTSHRPGSVLSRLPLGLSNTPNPNTLSSGSSLTQSSIRA